MNKKFKNILIQWNDRGQGEEMSNIPAILGGAPILNEEAGIVKPSISDYTTPELMERIEGILKSNMVTNGPTVREIEAAMAEYLGVDHVVAVSSCTLGQTLAIAAAGLQGKKMIVPSFTIAATANAAYWNQCEIVFADLDLDTFNFIYLARIAEHMDRHDCPNVIVHKFFEML